MPARIESVSDNRQLVKVYGRRYFILLITNTTGSVLFLLHTHTYTLFKSHANFGLIKKLTVDYIIVCETCVCHE